MAETIKGPFNGAVSFYKEQDFVAPEEFSADLAMYAETGVWDTIVQLADIYKERFPGQFSRVEPDTFVVTAAHLEFYNNGATLQKLQEIASGHAHLEHAVEAGISRGKYVREHGVAPPAEAQAIIAVSSEPVAVAVASVPARQMTPR